MALKTLVKKVLVWSNVPEDIREVSTDFVPKLESVEAPMYLEFHLTPEIEEPIDQWIKDNHPELFDEDSFLILI